LSVADAGSDADPLLRPLDRVQIVEERRQGVASAEGEVTLPGRYPIVIGETTLQDLVEAAGGVTASGLLRAAYLERRGAAWEAGGITSLEAVEDPAERAALLELQTFENARLSDLPFGSRQYMVREMLQFQRVSLDLDDLAALPPVPLRDGDRFVVPRDPNAILVIGQVRNPGYVTYRAGAESDYYIEQAGGEGPAATEVYVREAGSGYFRSPTAGSIRSGDFIFVDRDVIADTEALQALALQEGQLNFQRSQERGNRRFQYIQTGLAIVSTAVGIVTTYLFLTRDTSN
jgi:protein involved in polysaccharide export with SLBB domain